MWFTGWRKRSPGSYPSSSVEPIQVFASNSDANQPTRNWLGWLSTFTDAFRSRKIASLRHDLAEQHARATLLEGRLIEMQSQVHYLREEAATAHRNERLMYQTQVNVDMQRKYGVTVFPEAPKMPVSGEAPGKTSWNEFDDVRLMQAQAGADFRDEFKKRLGIAS